MNLGFWAIAGVILVFESDNMSLFNFAGGYMLLRVSLFFVGALFALQSAAKTSLSSDAMLDVPVRSKMVYGYLEKATLVEKNLTLKAKLDTGAKSASLYAKRIRYLEIDNKPFIQFVVPTKEGDVPFTCAHVGEVNIKSRSGEVAGMRIKNPFVKRPVVNMRVQLGEQTQVIRVNLANRKRFTYPLLLGREALVAFDGLVDAKQKYTLRRALAS